MLLYDNLEDVKTKLVNTFCYYDGQAVICKEAMIKEDGHFYLRVMPLNARQFKTVRLDDPKLNYMKFNLGYSNHTHSAVWWYRIPAKQWHQGLRHNQLGKNATREEFFQQVDWGFASPIVNMMENRYPKFIDCEQRLKDQDAKILAFHKNFACTWDKIHKDLILEYKGHTIGCVSGKDFKLMDEYQHLTEALKEAVA